MDESLWNVDDNLLLFKPDEKTKNSFKCCFCKSTLEYPYIECKECPNDKKPLICLHCFAKGVEFDAHKNDHGYTVKFQQVQVFKDSGWSADDELKLLEELEECGVGNWDQISARLGKTKEDCKEHFYKYYIDEPCPELSDMFDKENGESLIVGVSEEKEQTDDPNYNEDEVNLWTSDYISNMGQIKHDK